MGDPEVRTNVFKSLLLNILSLVFIHFFDLFLHPLVRDSQGSSWAHQNLGGAYQILWLCPIVGASVYLNTAWCSLLSKRTFTVLHGPRAAAALEFPTIGSTRRTRTSAALLQTALISAYRWTMIMASVLLDFLLTFVPWIGRPLSVIFLSWVNSYYFFESEWIGRGLNLPARVQNLEERWAYYLGFGFPAAILCSLASGLTSPALFALIFPYFVIVSMYSHPGPPDPYNSAASANQEWQGYGSSYGTSASILPVRLPVFAAVMWVHYAIIRTIEAITNTFGVDVDMSPFLAETYGGGYPYHHNVGDRADTQRKAENMEEGIGYSDSVEPAINLVGRPTPSSRVRIGVVRRKAE
ncbi:hypothetical protein PUNSTDRAFT_121199 [Punctularia strigosozonata HHB-11173 SS5]|uniref:uncharacterized protein n=1 Tax=Punctularia strigosozonata (strain HHB-11173) TaxID=741275 RepID=UPI0004417389|nr:uncharacterized protein PUNSTDRAFT_121199 [Punctularia strigosozonata HHB-11173 SS5]EIN08072.1 hypothetical protein PUNSTDRAFT_121199 [Punctularia strigosozonata HHB-11173 SS5]